MGQCIVYPISHMRINSLQTLLQLVSVEYVRTFHLTQNIIFYFSLFEVSVGWFAIDSWGKCWIMMVTTCIKTYSRTCNAQCNAQCNAHGRCFWLRLFPAEVTFRSFETAILILGWKLITRLTTGHATHIILLEEAFGYECLQFSTVVEKQRKWTQLGQFWKRVSLLLKMYLSTVEGETVVEVRQISSAKTAPKQFALSCHPVKKSFWVVALSKRYFELSPG